MQHAHDHGVVHRDIKPENILLDETGAVRLGDFGIARLVGGDEASSLTRTTAVLGTHGYMAPEQCEPGRSIDHRADIFALGVVLYEMLTGELPLGVFPRPSRSAGVDASVDAIVMKALEKDASRRQTSAAALGEEIRKRTCAPARTSRVARRLAIAALIVLILGGGAGLYLTRNGDGMATPVAETPAPPAPAYRELPGHGGKVWGVAFTRDGKTIATACEDKVLRLWDPATARLKASLPAYPHGEVGPLAVNFSPDNRHVRPPAARASSVSGPSRLAIASRRRPRTKANRLS